MTTANVSALSLTGPRRARAGAVVAGGLPGAKMTDVLQMLSTGSWAVNELQCTHEAVPLVTVVVVVEVLFKSQATGRDGYRARKYVHLVVFTTETAVVVVGRMSRKDEQNGVAL